MFNPTLRDPDILPLLPSILFFLLATRVNGGRSRQVGCGVVWSWFGPLSW
jgi:hypothetical protein